jgi:hypothetical protein
MWDSNDDRIKVISPPDKQNIDDICDDCFTAVMARVFKLAGKKE